MERVEAEANINIGCAYYARKKERLPDELKH